jgi:hypothetical protein
MSQITATNEQRAVYQEIKRFYEDMGNVIPTRGQLRLEQVGGAKNRYQFPVLNDEGNPRPSEKRLARTDAFWVDRIGTYLGSRYLDQTAGGTIGNQLYNAVTPLAYPDITVFAGSPLEAFSAQALLNGGTVSIEVDQVRWLQKFDTLRSRYVQAPDGAEAAWDDSKVMGKMVPTIRLNGGSSNVIEWAVNEAIDFTGLAPVTDEPGAENVLILILDGWYVANAGEFTPSRTM